MNSSSSGGLTPQPQEDRERLRCGLISTLPAQDGEKCDQRGQLHLLVRCPEHGELRGLLTCAGHYPVALTAGELVAEHEIGLWCGLPATYFDLDKNDCVLDDSGVEPPPDQLGRL